MLPPHGLHNITSHTIAHDSPYHYIPTKGVAITFITLYGLSTLLHLTQAMFYRLWWLIPTAGLSGLLEVIGWSGRLWSSFNPWIIGPFQMQITATIIAPTPLLAANFVILGAIIERIGSGYSRLKPKWYTIIFCTCDVISLVVQGVGGGLASSEAASGKARKGGNVMLGGIVFQLSTIVAFSILAVEFLARYAFDRPFRSGKATSRGSLNKRTKIMLAAIAFNTTCLFIRSVYRTFELSNGWDGRIISTQRYFNILDGGMVTLAIYTLNFAHPGLLLFRRFPKESSTPRSSSNDTTGASTPKMEPNSMQV